MNSIRSSITLFLVLVVFGLLPALLALADSVPHQRQGKDGWDNIPKEPGWKSPSYRGWELISIPGLISTFYDLNLNGELDYMVIRKIMRKASAEEISIEEAVETAKRDHLSVYISHPVIYFTNRYPLFYCRGLDFRKNCRNMWVDLSEDGLNGNESLYTLSKSKPFVR